VIKTDINTIVEKLIATGNGILTTAAAEKLGLSRSTLVRLVHEGKLIRIAQGQYIRPNDMADELFSIAQRSTKIIFSHETALFLHGLSERTPFIHSVTIPSDRKIPPAVKDYCKAYYIKPEFHEIGKIVIDTNMGNPVPAYDVERTVCDLLRNRSRIDNQTIADGMRNYMNRSNNNFAKLGEYADIFRVSRLLRNYIEVLG
jgi:predicted transcriptional regulator of viral defense system